MKQLLLVVLLAAAARASPDLRVKFGLTPLNIGSGLFYYYDLGTDLHWTWKQVERPADDYLLPALKLYCSRLDYTYCVFYDDTGYVAGTQIALPVEGSEKSVPSDPTLIGFRKWTPPGSDTTYWVHKMFFVSNETLAKTADERAAIREKTLFDGGVWVTDYNHELLFLNATAIKAEETKFTIQNCINGMGQHYFYNMTTEADPERLLPWFVLIHENELVAVGFYVFGIPAPGGLLQRDWFELPNRAQFKAIGPYAPEKVYEYADNPTGISLHTYFVDNPSSLKCDLSALI